MSTKGKVLLAALAAVIIAAGLWIAYLRTHPFRPQGTLGDEPQSISPDGAIVASEVYDDHFWLGLASPAWFGVTVSPAGDDPVDGQIAVFGGEFSTRWSGANQLDIIPECDGWVAEGRKSVEISGRQIAIRIAPVRSCPPAKTP